MALKKQKKRGHARPSRLDAKKSNFPSKTKDYKAKQGALWIYGIHAARAALSNPRRRIEKIVATPRALTEMGDLLPKGIAVDPAEPEAISKLVGRDAVHQGIALLCQPLPALSLEKALESVAPGQRLVAVLDQITDPHNEGAILRSAAAFGVCAVIVQNRHTAPESGALAKSASGALDIVQRVSVVNIARALEELGRMDFWRIALDGDATAPLSDVARKGDIAIVLGAEGAGVRRLVRKTCDAQAAIPINNAMGSLNVSNAAAIALYELRQTRTKAS